MPSSWTVVSRVARTEARATVPTRAPAASVRRMARDGREAGRSAIGALYEDRAAEYSRYADTIRKAVLLRLPPAVPAGDETA